MQVYRLFKYCRWISSYQRERVEMSLTGLTYLMFGSGFPTSYVVVFVVMRGGRVIARFVDIGGIEDHHLSFHN